MDYEKQFDSPRKTGQPDRRNEYSAASTHPPPPPRDTCGEFHEPVTPPAVMPRHAPPTAAAAAVAAAAPERRLHRAAPLFPPPVQRSRCRTATVTVFRVLVAVFAVAMVVFTIVGQVLPFCHQSDEKEEEKYSVWQLATTKVKKGKTEREAREDNAAEKAFAVLSAALSLIACILCFVFLGLWVRYEQERRREADAYAEAKRCEEEQEMQDSHNMHTINNGRHNANSHRRLHNEELRAQDSFKCDCPTAYPQAFGTKDEIYARERRRRHVDGDVGTAAFSFLIAAAAASLVTVALMAHFYNEEVGDEVEAKKGETAGYMVGFGLFIAALALGVVSFVLVALPCLTELYLCCGPRAATPKTPLVSPSSSASLRLPATDPPVSATQVAAGGASKGNQTSHNNNNNNNCHGAGRDDSSVPLQSSPSAPAPAETQAHRSNPLNPPRPQSQHASPPPPPPGPQPYVPTVVGTYPEALPGPATMENVRLHHVAQDGTTTSMQHPSTQVAWRGGEAASGQFVASAQGGPPVEQSGYASDGYYTSA